MIPHFLLNSFLPWNDILALLGRPAEVKSLPARVACPLCHAEAALRVAPDVRDGGQWYLCDSCGFAGDSLTLVCKAWSLPVAEALLKLSRRGFQIPPFDDQWYMFHAGDVATITRVNEFWRTASARRCPYDNPTWLRLQRKLGIRNSPAVGDRMARLLGYAHRRDIDAVFHPHVSSPNQDRFTSRSRHRSFRGRGWEEVVVVPYWSSPGRIATLWIVGRQGDGPPDEFHRRADAYKTRQVPTVKVRYEAGLALLPALAESSPSFGDAVFCVPDIRLAVRLQARHAVDWPAPLPLVSSRRDVKDLTADSWAQCGIEGSRVVFWGKPEASLFAQARAAGGRVSSSYPDQGTAKDYIAKVPPEALLRRMAEHCESWRDALCRAVAATPGRADAERLVLETGLPGAELDDLLDGAVPSVRAKLSGLRDRSVTAIAPSGRCVTERNGVWSSGAELVADAIVRIDTAVLKESNGRIQYTGRVVRGGREVPFHAPANWFDKDPWRFVRAACAAGGLGLPSLSSKWAKEVSAVARQFHPPEIVKSSTLAGWDASRGAFVFPGFGVEAGGEECGTFGVEAWHQAGAGLPAPDALPPEDVAFFESGVAGAAVAWGMAAVAAGSAVAAAAGVSAGRFAVYGPGTVAARAAAHACGFARADLSHGISRLPKTPGPYPWPVLVAPDGVSGMFLDTRSASRAALMPTNTVCLAGPAVVDLVLMGEGWEAVYCPECRDIGPDGAAGRLLTAWLRDFCRRKLDVPGAGGDPYAAARADLAAWFHAETSAKAPPALPLRRGGRDRLAANFAAFVTNLVACHKVKCRDGETTGRAGSKMVVAASRIEATAGPWLRSTGHDADSFLLALRDAGVPVTETTVDGAAVWAVPARWLEAQRNEAAGDFRFRTVG